MIADAAKLVCETCTRLYCQIQADKYGITNCCDALDSKASIYLWLLNSGCTLTRDMTCQIGDYIDKQDDTYTDPVDTASNICGVSTNDTSAGATSCTQTPNINVLL